MLCIIYHLVKDEDKISDLMDIVVKIIYSY